MNILLLYPNIHGMNMLPPALALFASLLKEQGHKVDLFDSTNWIIPGEGPFDSDKAKEQNLNVRPFDDSKLREELRDSDVFEDFRKKVETFSPELIAVSVTEDIFPVGIKLLGHSKQYKIPSIMGGVFPTFAPELCLSYGEVDMICVGEGEKAIVELCSAMEKGKPYDNINNLWIKKGDFVKKNPISAPVNMDENPLLDLSIFDSSRLYRPMQGKVWRMLPVETHRGCCYQCTYCNSPSQNRLYRRETGCNFFRKKSFDAMRKELVYFKDVIKAEAFYFWADTFLTYTETEFDQFIEMYSEVKLPFWCQTHPKLISETHIKKLMDVGLFRIAAGIEHGNEQFRRQVLRRNVSNDLIIKNFEILNKCGLPFSVNNIIGFPLETRELAMDTIEINRKIASDNANCYSYSPFHGTPLREMAEELGFCDSKLIARSLTKPTLLNMPQFPPQAIEGLRRCFILYVKMPKNRWPEIQEAEALTPQGDKIWQDLRDECAEKYMKS